MSNRQRLEDRLREAAFRRDRTRRDAQNVVVREFFRECGLALLPGYYLNLTRHMQRDNNPLYRHVHWVGSTVMEVTKVATYSAAIYQLFS